MATKQILQTSQITLFTNRPSETMPHAIKSAATKFSVTRQWVMSFILALVFFSDFAQAETSHEYEFGDYTVHFNAFNSDVLQPNMAEAYGIVRSKNRGMMTVSILKKGDPDTSSTPVRAHVDASASNLTGQFRKFKIREINEKNSIYYISVFHVAHEEMLDFTLQILPEGETKTHTVTFRQQFFTH